jgi:hypothetical protein
MKVKGFIMLHVIHYFDDSVFYLHCQFLGSKHFSPQREQHFSSSGQSLSCRHLGVSILLHIMGLCGQKPALTFWGKIRHLTFRYLVIIWHTFGEFTVTTQWRRQNINSLSIWRSPKKFLPYWNYAIWKILTCLYRINEYGLYNPRDGRRVLEST